MARRVKLLSPEWDTESESDDDFQEEKEGCLTKKVHLREKQPEDAETPKYCRRRRVILTHEIGQLTIREYDNIACDGSLLVLAFPGEGLTAIMTANFLKDALKLSLIGEIVSPSFPMVCYVSGQQTMHGCRIHGDNRVVVLVCEYTGENEHDMIAMVFDFATRHRCAGVVCVEGAPLELSVPKDLDLTDATEVLEYITKQMEKKRKMSLAAEQAQEMAKKATTMQMIKEEEGQERASQQEQPQQPEKEPSEKAKEKAKKSLGEKKLKQKRKREEKKLAEEPLRYITNDEEWADRFLALGLKPVHDALISGIAGGIAAECATADIQVACIISRFNAILPPSPRPAIPVVTAIAQLLGNRVEPGLIDVKPLREKARTLEEKLKKSLGSHMRSSSSSDASHLHMYM